MTSSLIFVVLSAVLAFSPEGSSAGGSARGRRAGNSVPGHDRRVPGGRQDLIKYGIARPLARRPGPFLREGGRNSFRAASLRHRRRPFPCHPVIIPHVLRGHGGNGGPFSCYGTAPLCHYGCLLAPFMTAGRFAARVSGTPHLHLERRATGASTAGSVQKTVP